MLAVVQGDPAHPALPPPVKVVIPRTTVGISRMHLRVSCVVTHSLTHSREAFASSRPLPFRSAVSGGTYGPRGYSSTLTVGCTLPSGGGEPRLRQMAYGANSCLSMRIAGAPRARFLKLRLHKRGNLQKVYDIRHATHRRTPTHRRMEAHASASARLANDWRALSRIVRCYSHRRVRLQCARGVRRARRSVEETRRKAAADHCSWCTARRRCCTCIVRWARSA